MTEDDGGQHYEIVDGATSTFPTTLQYPIKKTNDTFLYIILTMKNARALATVDINMNQTDARDHAICVV